MTHFLFLLLVLPLSQTVGGEWGFHHTLPPHGQPGSSLGSQVVLAGDLDGDPVPDFFASGFDSSAGPPTRAVRWIAGATGASLHVAVGSNRHEFGAAILAHPDWNGDGVPDLVVGAPLDDAVLWDGGAVTVWSGSTGLLLERIEIGVRDAHFGSSLALYPDSDGDGRLDFLVGSVEISSLGPNEHGAVFLMSSATGQPLRQFDGALTQEQLGSSVLCTGDLDGDGVADLAAGSSYSTASARVTFFSGASGAVLRRYQPAGVARAGPWALADAGDVDGDGVPDQLAGLKDTTVSGQVRAGSVVLLSGASGAVLWQRTGSAALDSFGGSVGLLGDVDGDGRQDMAATAAQRVEVLDLATGALLGSYERNDGISSMAAGADFDGDGRLDWVVGEETALAGAGQLEIGGFKAGLDAGSSSVSASLGGAIPLALDFPDQRAGQGFHLLASLFGAGPFHRDGVAIPLTPDVLLKLTAFQPNLGPFQPPRGPLDSRGDASSQLVVPPGAAVPFLGRSLNLAAVCFGPSGTVLASSVANPVLILP